MKLPPERDDPVWSRLRQHDVEELWDPSVAPHVASAHQARIALLQGLLMSHVTAPARILDVGCAQGTLGLLLAEQGYRVTLLDVRSQAIAYARERHERGAVDFVVGRLGVECPPEADYDAVLCTEVLEHVPHPSHLLVALSAKVRPGGVLLLTTPNADYSLAHFPTYSRANQEVIDQAPPDSMDGDEHRFLFTRSEVVALVRGVGLRVEGAGFFSPFWLEGHLKTRYLHRLAYRVTGRTVKWHAQRAVLPRWSCASQWILATRRTNA